MHKSKLLIPMVLMVAMAAAQAAEVSKSQADSAIQEAKVAYQRVEAVGFAWTETEELIQSAEKAQASGQMEQAVNFAKQATERSNLGYAQYEENKNADMESTSK